MYVRLGLVGKTNTGKTTFFNAMTHGAGEVSAYPFTTKTHAEGTAYATTPCVHARMNVVDEPVNTHCTHGYRHIPVTLTDLPGLISDAWRGRGMGNRFLAVASRSNALIHMVDASGGVDSSGMLTSPGTGDPVSDLADIEEELVMWYQKIFEGNREKISRAVDRGANTVEAISRYMGGMGVTPAHVAECLKDSRLSGPVSGYAHEDTRVMAGLLRRVSKPTVIVANKMDVEGSEENYARLQRRHPEHTVIPASGDCELTLRTAAGAGIVRLAQDGAEVLRPKRVDARIQDALDFADRPFMRDRRRGGAQAVINAAVFDVLGMVSAYPVADPQRLTDGRGRVLPDIHLLEPGSTVRDLARVIHHDMARGSIRATIVNDGRQVRGEHEVRDGSIVHLIPQSGP